MQKISCILVDDEPLALDLLERYVIKTPFLDCRSRCSSALEAMEIISKHPVDLIFLDIQMPQLSGIELSRIIDKNTRIVFTTAFNEYALDGFKVNALDYLLKPFNFEEYSRAVNRAREWFDLVGQNHRPLTGGRDFIFVKSEYKQVKIMLDDVVYIEGLKDYVKIWLEGNPKPKMSLISLKTLEKELHPTRFMRIHRSFIVALDKIQSVERSQVIIGNKVRINIAEQYREKFNHFLNGKMLC
ncbi:MAG: response regulator transcription factor [Bacteroidales bacterium]|nr:response regulator transcription factor [Bacteroidales bacterium]MBK9356040.1 response regulator transcription factor [Bacteroidales bacterium]